MSSTSCGFSAAIDPVLHNVLADISATLLCLITAHDAVRPWEVGKTKMKESREVRSQVAKTETQVDVVRLATSRKLK